MLDRVQDSRHVVRLHAESHCELGQRALVDSLVGLRGERLEHSKEVVFFSKLFKAVIVEPEMD